MVVESGQENQRDCGTFSGRDRRLTTKNDFLAVRGLDYRQTFRRTVPRHRGDYKAQSFSCWDQFPCLAFAQLTYCESLCDIEVCLRLLYFLLAGVVKKLVYLHTGLACVLIFIGAKMVGEDFVPIPMELSLLIVGGILGVAVVASLLKTKLEG